jgi:hypothetical protein
LFFLAQDAVALLQYDEFHFHQPSAGFKMLAKRADFHKKRAQRK